MNGTNPAQSRRARNLIADALLAAANSLITKMPNPPLRGRSAILFRSPLDPHKIYPKHASNVHLQSQG
jgi:hypothetical protein